MPHPDLPIDGLSDLQQPTARWASSLAYALARDEVAGRRTPRITEPNRATWNRFAGRLTSADFLLLLFEDAAVTHPIPFDRSAIDPTLRPERLDVATVTRWLDALATASTGDPDYIAEQAKRLGLPYRMARSDLHVVKQHQRVLELPGTGGQLAHHLVTTQSDLNLKDNVQVACETWAERTLAGIVGLDVGTADNAFVRPIEPGALRDAEHPLRTQSFDFVIGLDPSKGGQFQRTDELAIWFPKAKVVLV